MIYESVYWKEPLLNAVRLIRKCAQSVPDENDLGQLEYSVMTGFFAIRKLIDAQLKLSASTLKTKFSVLSHDYQGESEPCFFDRHELEKHYNEKPEKRTISLEKACNQFIHSFVFMFECDEDERVSGVFVSSDYDKSKQCLRFDIREIEKVFDLIGNDYPADIRVSWESGLWRVETNGSVRVMPERKTRS